jgi:hypothetical protein
VNKQVKMQEQRVWWLSENVRRRRIKTERINKCKKVTERNFDWEWEVLNVFEA